MTLKEWMEKEGLNDRQAAEVIGIRNINPSTNINRYKSFKRIPQKKVMKMIYIATKGKVQPNDFYDLKI
jgi:predicted XRE-type DNA-binding protein